MARILVVDDEPAHRDSLRRIFERAGHEVLVADDGQAALAVLRSETVAMTMLPGGDEIQRVELGRRLFYEPLLSRDASLACSSCHQQVAAFGTYEHDLSHGVFDSHTLRNAPVLFNMAWSPVFHWDGEFNSLIHEATQPINGKNEMEFFLPP